MNNNNNIGYTMGFIGVTLAFIGVIVLMCEGGPAFLLIGIAMAVIGFIIGNSIFTAQLKEHFKKMDEDAHDKKLVEFYKHCKKEHINNSQDLDNKGKFEKAKLIAEQYHISFEQIKEMFSKGEQLFIEQTKKDEDKKVKQLSEEEMAQRLELNRYSEYIGRDKKLAILRNELDVLQKQLSGDYATMNDSCSTSGYQKEQSWAVHAGIADALAGPAAGVATAIDVQQRNQQTRNQNEALFALKSMTYGMAKESAEKIKPKIDKLVTEINETKVKLVSDETPEDVFKHLECSVVSCNISPTGNFKINAKIVPIDNIPIFDNKNTVIDGTILATMYQDNKSVGQAKLVLPTNGAPALEVYGISDGNADANKEFEIVFEPYNLWAMEA